jgi:hypothetical protein
MGRDRNTFAKRAREQAKKQKADEKRLRRARKQEESVPQDSQGASQEEVETAAELPILPFPVRSTDTTTTP